MLLRPNRTGRACSTMFNTENRGQVGIGTLIVFIAMVLVAAIAAGVLINTAGLLQAQAQQTGEETTAEVSDVIQIGEVLGVDSQDGGSNDGKLDRINLSVRLASGSDPINLSQASYTLSSPRGNATVVNGNPNSYASSPSDNQTESNEVEIVAIQGIESDTDDLTNASVLKDQEDLFEVQLDLGELNNIEPLEEAQRVKIIVQAPAGGQSYKEVQAPRDIEDGGSYIL